MAGRRRLALGGQVTAVICLSGRVAVTVDDRRIDERALPGGQPRVVLGLLACERHRWVPREELADNLWPDGRPATWKTALRGVVRRVRDYLVEAGLGDRDVVQADAGTYRLQPVVDVVVDIECAVHDAEGAASALDAGRPREALERADRAGTVLARPLLPGVRSPWLDVERRSLGRHLVSTLEVLARSRLALGDHAQALGAAQEAIALDPFRESAHRLAIRAHMAAGNLAAGLRAYERCRSLLAEELGVDPGRRTRALHSTMLSQVDAASA